MRIYMSVIWTKVFDLLKRNEQRPLPLQILQSPRRHFNNKTVGDETHQRCVCVYVYRRHVDNFLNYKTYYSFFYPFHNYIGTCNISKLSIDGLS